MGRNKNNIAVDNSGSRNKDRNPIIGYKDHKGKNQIWVPEMVNGNTIRWRNPATNKCMETRGRLFYINTSKNQIPIKCLILDTHIMHQLLLLLNQLLLLLNHIIHLYIHLLLTLTLVKENQM